MRNRETTFSCVEELVNEMIDTVLEFDDEFASVTLVANPEIINKVFKEFSSIEVNGFEINYDNLLASRSDLFDLADGYISAYFDSKDLKGKYFNNNNDEVEELLISYAIKD